MPISFIIISILIFTMVYFKNFKPLNANKLYISVILLFFLCGYFIAPADFSNKFNINIIFSFLTLIVSVELVSRLKSKDILIVICMTIATIIVYFIITRVNDEYLTFLNYVPLFVLVSIISLLLVGRREKGLAYITLTYLGIEFFNLILLSDVVGYLNVFSIESVDFLVYSMTIYCGLEYLFKIFSKNRNKNTKVKMNNEK